MYSCSVKFVSDVLRSGRVSSRTLKLYSASGRSKPLPPRHRYVMNELKRMTAYFVVVVVVLETLFLMAQTCDDIKFFSCSFSSFS